MDDIFKTKDVLIQAAAQHFGISLEQLLVSSAVKAKDRTISVALHVALTPDDLVAIAAIMQGKELPQAAEDTAPPKEFSPFDVVRTFPGSGFGNAVDLVAVPRNMLTSLQKEKLESMHKFESQRG